MDYLINVGYKWPVTRGKNIAGSILMSYIKINPRWLKNLNVKNKVVRTKKENIKNIYILSIKRPY